MGFRFEEHSRCEVLGELVREQLGGNSGWGERREYRPGSLLWRGTDAAGKVFLLEKGRVDVRWEKELVQVIREGELFGEICFCPKSQPPHGVSGRAVGRTVVREAWVIGKGASLLRHVEFSSLLIGRFCERVANAEARAKILAMAQGERRVLMALEYLSGRRGAGSVTMGQAELAEFVGMTRPHTTVVLTRLRREGRIEYERGGPIRILLR